MTITKKFEPQQIQKKLPKKYIGLAIFGLFVLVIVEIWASNTVIAYGEKLEDLTLLEKNLKIENQLLENEIAKNSSLQVVASQSSQLGFTLTKSIQYIR